MTPRILVPVLSCLLIGAGLGYWLLGGAGGRRAEAPRTEGAAAHEALVPGAAAELATATALDSASIPVAEAARRAVTPLPAALTTDAAETRLGGTAIVGRVVDEAGAPVAAASVSLASNARGFFQNAGAGAGAVGAVTDAEGAFRLALERAGETWLEVRAAGFAPATVDRVAAAAGGETKLESAVVLERSATLLGVVLDDTGAPLEGARVSLLERVTNGFGFGEPRRSDEQITGPDGTFRLDQLPRRTLELSVTHDSFVDHGESIDASTPVELPRLSIDMGRGAAIEGRLKGVPPDVTAPLLVMAHPGLQRPHVPTKLTRRADVRPDGTFRLEGLRAGSSWSVFACTAAEDEATPVVEVDKARVSEVVQVEAGRRNLILNWEAGCTLTFTVVDATSQEPIEALSIQESTGGRNRRRSSRSGDFPDGIVRLERRRANPEGEPLELTVDAPGYAAWSKSDLVLVSGRDIDLGTIELTPTPALSITVLDDRDGAPVRNARVTWFESGTGGEGKPGIEGASFVFTEVRRATAMAESSVSFPRRNIPRIRFTDEHGQVVFDGLDGSTVDLIISADGFAAARITGWELPAGVGAERVVRLVQGGSVRVTATDALGQPLGGRTIEHRSPAVESSDRQTLIIGFHSQGGKHVTDADGHVLIENLSVGENAFRIASVDPAAETFQLRLAGEVHTEAEDEIWSSVEVVSGKTSELALVEAPRAVLTGRITAGGQPLKDARVSLRAKAEESKFGAGAKLEVSSMNIFGPSGPEIRTDRNGRYRVADLEPGAYALTIDHEARAMPFKFDVTLGTGETQRNFDLGIAIIAGRVVDPDGQGVAGVAVSVERTQLPDSGAAFSFVLNGVSGTSGGRHTPGSVVTDATGAYELFGVVTDVELVVVADGASANWQSARSEPLTVAPDELVQDVDIEVQPAGSLDFRVRRMDGTFPDFVPLEYSRADADPETRPERTFLRGGIGKLEGLAPGTWSVRATDIAQQLQGDDARGVEREVEVTAGETLRVELELPD
ncbi:MAG: carboxypeptidase regulatory-like domain-containing protein [Planctomycetota bacterium]